MAGRLRFGVWGRLERLYRDERFRLERRGVEVRHHGAEGGRVGVRLGFRRCVRVGVVLASAGGVVYGGGA